MSSIVPRSDSAERCAMSSCRMRCGDVSPSRASCSIPITPCSGVRISCDMFARKSLLAAFASSARTVSSSSRWMRSRDTRIDSAICARRFSDVRALIETYIPATPMNVSFVSETAMPTGRPSKICTYASTPAKQKTLQAVNAIQRRTCVCIWSATRSTGMKKSQLFSAPVA